MNLTLIGLTVNLCGDKLLVKKVIFSALDSLRESRGR
jgi:hypothetical protein